VSTLPSPQPPPTAPQPPPTAAPNRPPPKPSPTQRPMIIVSTLFFYSFSLLVEKYNFVYVFRWGGGECFRARVGRGGV
jgi:hypothetical protein